ncbi:MAG: DNA polymerase III subunit beta [Candidatus Wildermuthbacteria bacterium RIFCSPHIGHO2_01_FULL_48_25]|uniref:Beta sliding clamp n=1 Tax=Candidatus Wildermuthbacteria bacterium RIFCSPLOWO2_01_FULL_48_16 TaxID=1802461 RepID=A0A1G2RL39_9BACT|nr:MAG: DNA polymerase III subunit beta [Candidatus Wildermuthbacteria bacterium RIFCSPHIGHO2_01_FULL_48_25]OHA68201.1 MAG: DNA polymerase III subunit beta [Candidatus Wildermuthbacteria bacterium RIFCSPHIGHO2_02_FULL_49_12b]OHA73079.1 MAG: DNA polymerase III subunit beta [Candidatus Wildermuthbacteria bacterium RIFCSPLOWO2_01_FULL_48_16]
MKTTVLKDFLKEGISMAERVCAKNPSLPVLSNILMVAEKNILQISATDLEIGVHYKALAKNDKDGSVVVPPRALSQFVSSLTSNQAVLTLKEKQLEVQSGNFKALLKTLDPEDFPIIPSPKGDEPTVEIDAGALVEGVASVIGFVGQTQARPEISGILFSFSQKTLKLVSTDSFRLAEKTVSTRTAAPKEHSFILPAKAARELVNALGERQGKVKIYFSPTQASFFYSQQGEMKEPQIQLVSRLIEGEYPKYQDVIPSNIKTKAILNKNDLIAHLKAASVFSGRTNDVHFILNPQKKAVEVRAQSQDLGEDVSSLEAKVEGEKREVSFNWRFFLEGLAQMKSERVDFGLANEEGPALVRPGASEEFLYVLMPLKL